LAIELLREDQILIEPKFIEFEVYQSCLKNEFQFVVESDNTSFFLGL